MQATGELRVDERLEPGRMLQALSAMVAVSAAVPLAWREFYAVPPLAVAGVVMFAVGRTLARRHVDAGGVLDEDVLVVPVERDGETITPKGDTTVHAGDQVTVFSQRGFDPQVTRVFAGERD